MARLRYNGRPHSAKPGRMANVNLDELQMQSEISSRDRMPTNINNATRSRQTAKQLFMNEYARITPTTFYHDSQQLYSEALKLKQKTNATTDENVRLKTKVAILQKEKTKLMRYIQQDVRMRSQSRSGNQQPDISGMEKSREKDNKLASLRRLLAEAKDEIQFLKGENTQIKKSVKYTKLSESDIEKRMILEESTRLRKIIDEYEAELDERREYSDRENQLEKQLRKTLKQNEDLYQKCRSSEEVIQFIESKAKESEKRFVQKEKKLTKELSDCKKRLADSVLEAQSLRRQLQNKHGHYQSNSNTGNYLRSDPFSSDAQYRRIAEELQHFKQKNSELERQINQRRSDHISSAHTTDGNINQIKARRPQTSKTASSKANKQHTVQSIDGQEFKKKQTKEIVNIEPIEYRNTKKKPTLPQPFAAEPNKIRQQNKNVVHKLNEAEPSIKRERNSPVKEEPKKGIYQNVKKIQSPPKQVNSLQKSLKSKEPLSIQIPRKDELQEKLKQMQALNISLNQHQVSPQSESYSQEFQADQVERKNVQEYAQSKTIDNRERELNKNKWAKLRELEDIKQLLTYRMKAQRYPFYEVKKDIIESGEISFRLNDLASMLSQLPFYLNNDQIQNVLCFIFDTSELKEDMVVSTDSFIGKLRQLIDDFHIITPEEEKETTDSIILIVEEKQKQLEKQFERRSNSQGCITKEQMEQVLAGISLSKQSIQLIIAEVSLSSTDMSTLNYSAIFKYFKQEQDCEGKMSEVVEQDEHSGDSGFLKERKQAIKPYQVEAEDSIGLFEAQSFSMRAGDKQPIDYEILSDQDLHI